MDVEQANTADIDELVGLRIAYLTEDNGALDADDEEAINRGLPSYYEAHLGRDLYVYVIREDQAIISCAFLIVVQKPEVYSYFRHGVLRSFSKLYDS